MNSLIIPEIENTITVDEYIKEITL
jgi:hypothetical protein